jgi:hypothetical protein
MAIRKHDGVVKKLGIVSLLSTKAVINFKSA